MRFFRWCLPVLSSLLALPYVASAHEVYVLSHAEVEVGLATQPFDMFAVMQANFGQFAFWGFIAFVIISGIFLISIIRPMEALFDPFLRRGRKYAPLIARVTVGIAFVAAAYFQASFGPELPLLETYGSYTPIMQGILAVTGVLIIFGLYTRIAAGVALAIYCLSVYLHGKYMLTYTNYLGEIMVLLILGAGHAKIKGRDIFARFARWLEPYSFAILRILFGVSLLYSAIYAKILHNELALQVAELPLGHAYPIVHYLHFEPHFLVLGAAIVEVLIALFFIVGFEIRFTALFIEFWLALSLFYFGESVWPHLILVGIPIAFIFYGYDKYSLEGKFFKKGNREPIL